MMKVWMGDLVSRMLTCPSHLLCSERSTYLQTKPQSQLRLHFTPLHFHSAMFASRVCSTLATRLRMIRLHTWLLALSHSLVYPMHALSFLSSTSTFTQHDRIWQGWWRGARSTRGVAEGLIQGTFFELASLRCHVEFQFQRRTSVYEVAGPATCHLASGWWLESSDTILQRDPLPQRATHTQPNGLAGSGCALRQIWSLQCYEGLG